MNDLYGRVTNDQNALTRLLAKIPGFTGYVERENRRSADKMLREIIADRFEELWQKVSRLQRDLISQRQIAYVDDLESAAIKMRQFIDRVRHSSYGYAGFFDAVKIREDELARLYEFDLKLMEQVDLVGSAIDNVESSIGSDGLPASIRHLVSVTEQAIELYNRRNEAMLNVS